MSWLSHKYLSWLYSIVSYVRTIDIDFENYYMFLHDTPKDVYTYGKLKVGHMLSRSMTKITNITLFPYTQHYGFVCEIINENKPNEIIMVRHFQDNKIKKTTLEEYMLGEKILNVYQCNPNFIDLNNYSDWDGSYNFITKNCEHAATHFIEGVSRSIQVEVLYDLLWGALWNKNYMPPDTFKRIPKERYYINSFVL